MIFQELTIEQRLEFYYELMSCSGRFYLWQYDARGELVNTNCKLLSFHKLFLATGLMEYLLDYIKTSHKLVILTITQGLLWCADFETDEDEQIKAIYLYGPVATQELSEETMVSIVNNSLVSVKWGPKFRKYLRQIPVVMTTSLFQQAVMFHYCITGEKINVADIQFYSSRTGSLSSSAPPVRRDRLQTYMAERELLRMVREGQLDYKKALSQATRVSVGVGSGEKDALRSAAISQIVFISLCTRAAIEGGISPETAYSKGDAYINDLHSCTTVSDLVNVGHAMYDDFIRTVHNHSRQELYSPPVQSCCDYIGTHLDKDIELQDMAKRVGYTEYYLSRKFKKETGMSVNEYIRNARISQAKNLLSSSQLSIQQISDTLHFGSRSFFTDTFTRIVGIPPAQYRRENQKL